MHSLAEQMLDPPGLIATHPKGASQSSCVRQGLSKVSNSRYSPYERTGTTWLPLFDTGLLPGYSAVPRASARGTVSNRPAAMARSTRHFTCTPTRRFQPRT